MANARDIKRRIKSVKSTQQITKAMKMVSASKLRKSQTAVQTVRPFTAKIESVIADLAVASDHEFLHARNEVKKVCYVVIGSDRGLCGGFNGNMNRYLDSVLREEEHDYALIVIGRKVYDHCRRMKYPVDHMMDPVGDNPSYHHARKLGAILSEGFKSKKYDEIHLIYSEFKSAIAQFPNKKQLLPVESIESAEEEGIKSDYIYEPDKEEILETLLPQYIEIDVFCSMQNAKASEHGARMTAMSSATDNASDMISKLTLSLNRARQAAITTEISEIVGGAAALN